MNCHSAQLVPMLHEKHLAGDEKVHLERKGLCGTSHKTIALVQWIYHSENV